MILSSNPLTHHKKSCKGLMSVLSNPNGKFWHFHLIEKWDVSMQSYHSMQNQTNKLTWSLVEYLLMICCCQMWCCSEKTRRTYPKANSWRLERWILRTDFITIKTSMSAETSSMTWVLLRMRMTYLRVKLCVCLGEKDCTMWTQLWRKCYTVRRKVGTYRYFKIASISVSFLEIRWSECCS